MRKFIILAHPRTGSNFLIKLLASHPDVKVYNEPFNLHQSYKQLLSDPAQRLEEVFEKKHSCTTVTCFKLLYDQMTSQDLIFTKAFPSINNRFEARTNKVLQAIRKVGTESTFHKFEKLWNRIVSDESISVIHLQRRNYLHTLTSLIYALQNDRWVMHKDDSQADITSNIFISYETCEDFFNKISKQETYYEGLFAKHNCLKIYYEDLIDSPGKHEVLIQDFFGVKQTQLSSNLVKLNARKYSASIKNYADLKYRFQNSLWSHLFVE